LRAQAWRKPNRPGGSQESDIVTRGYIRAPLNVERLKTAAPILKSFADDKKINVVGGIYRLKTGRVELLT
jgi:carbonic anhydrase